MTTFFECIKSMHRFTMDLDCHRETIQCQRCRHSEYLVPHGFVYRRGCNRLQDPVGKRLLCSKRYGRQGCGATLRLYLQHRVPRLRYCATSVTVFVMALIAGDSIQSAYFNATSCYEPRNGFRWLARLRLQEPLYRLCFWRHARAGEDRTQAATHPRLLSLMHRWFAPHGEHAVAAYQGDFQQRFF